ncbi:MAG TPA: NAD(P)H-binding protein [Lactobacillaceae bacterium]|jgi:hypothetical protein
MKTLVIGGTGFAGGFIAKELGHRGHEVTVLSRSETQDKVANISYIQGSAFDQALRTQLLENVDVVVAAVSPRGDMAGKLRDLYVDLTQEVAQREARLIVVGGFTALRPAAGQPRLFESSDIPAEYKAEVVEMINVLDDLQETQNLNWLYVSPAAMFGMYLPVEDHGTPLQNGDVAIFNENGESKISGADFAMGVVDEIESNAHSQEVIGFAQA